MWVQLETWVPNRVLPWVHLVPIDILIQGLVVVAWMQQAALLVVPVDLAMLFFEAL